MWETCKDNTFSDVLMLKYDGGCGSGGGGGSSAKIVCDNEATLTLVLQFAPLPP